MAKTTSTSSKAKTKTTKKPAVKAAKKTTAKAAAKSTKVIATQKASVEKPVAKKTAAVKDKVNTRSRTPVTAKTIRRLHAFSGIVFVVLAIVSVLYMQVTNYQVTVGYLTRDALLSDTSTVFAPAAQVLYDLDLRWLVAGILGLSALFSLLRMTRLSASEDKGLSVRVQPWRWVDMAITGALMIETVGLVYGMQDVVLLKALGVVTVLSVVFAWVAERENANAQKFVKGAYLANLLGGLAIIVGMAAYGLATYVYGVERLPWYAYALFGAAAVTAGLVARLQFAALRRKGALADYLLVERNYLVLNLLAKTAFALILIVGLYK